MSETLISGSHAGEKSTPLPAQETRGRLPPAGNGRRGQGQGRSVPALQTAHRANVPSVGAGAATQKKNLGQRDATQQNAHRRPEGRCHTKLGWEGARRWLCGERQI